MARYFKFIDFVQDLMLTLSIMILCATPAVYLLAPEMIGPNVLSQMYSVSLASVFFVMAIRPLADILPKVKWVRPLVILRKGFGVFSASIIVSLMVAKIIELGFWPYIAQYFHFSYWMFADLKFFAHLGDVAAVLLLLTSNNLSKKILGRNWKRLQKLAYVYFYSGAIYEASVFGSRMAVVATFVVSVLLLASYFYRQSKKKNL